MNTNSNADDDSLPPMERVIARIFRHLAITHGAQFERSLSAGVPLEDVRKAWASELAMFRSEGGLKRIAWALGNLPDMPPNLMQFRSLVRRAPYAEPTLKLSDRPSLPVLAAGRARVAEAVAKVKPRHPRARIADFKEREAAGELLTLAQRTAIQSATRTTTTTQRV